MEENRRAGPCHPPRYVPFDVCADEGGRATRDSSLLEITHQRAGIGVARLTGHTSTLGSAATRVARSECGINTGMQLNSSGAPTLPVSQVCNSVGIVATEPPIAIFIAG